LYDFEQIFLIGGVVLPNHRRRRRRTNHRHRHHHRRRRTDFLNVVITVTVVVSGGLDWTEGWRSGGGAMLRLGEDGEKGNKEKKIDLQFFFSCEFLVEKANGNVKKQNKRRENNNILLL
jgi:hypothetical protein